MLSPTVSYEWDVCHSDLLALLLFLSKCHPACRSATCSSFPCSMGTSPAPFFHSSLFPLFHSLCLGDSVFPCIHPCLTNQGSLDIRSDFVLDICCCVVLSLFHAMPALQNPDNFHCDRYPRRLLTTRRIFLAQPLDFFQLQPLPVEVQFLVCQS